MDECSLFATECYCDVLDLFAMDVMEVLKRWSRRWDVGSLSVSLYAVSCDTLLD